MAASTWKWIGVTSSATISSNWTLLGGPGNANGFPASGDTGIDTDGQILLPFDGTFVANLLELGGTGGAVATLSSFGDGSIATGNGPVTFANPTFDANTVLTSNVPGQVTAETSVLDADGTFVNQGSILADGPSGSEFTINAGATSFNGTTAPGYFYDPGVIQADAGNTLTINIGAGSEYFNDGEVIADGGSVKITTSPSAIAGGFAAVRGFDLIEGGGTIETADFEPASDGNNGNRQEYEFADATTGDTLKIDNIGSFSGAIIGFQAGDTIDLGTALAVSTLSYSTASNFLYFEAANGTTLASLILGNFGTGLATGTFPLSGGVANGITVGVGGDGDTILTTANLVEPTSGVSGVWQSAGSWENGIVPTATASVAIGYGASAPFTLTTGSAPVTVGGAGLYSADTTFQITSDTTLTTGQLSDYGGTVDLTSGNTLTASGIILFTPLASVTIAAGATADLSGRLNQDLAAQNGQWALQPGDNPSAFSVSSGTAVVDGAVLAGPAVGVRGGSTSIGYEGNGASSGVIVNPGATVTDTHTTMGSDPTSAGTLTIDDATWTDFIDTQDTFSSRGNMNVGYDDVALNTPAGTPPPQEVAPAILTIENNSVVTEQQGAQIADTEDSAGEVTVETGAVWNIGTPGTGYELGIGYGANANGTLSVLNGGTVAIYGGGTYLSNGTSVTTAGGIGVGKSAGASGTIIVSGAGSELSSTNGMAVGQFGQALVSIVNGGTVLISGNGIGIGESAAVGASGTVEVGGSGAAAALDFLPASGSVAAGSGMTVGQQDPGTLNVGDNGTITLGGTGGIGVGQSAGVTGIITVGGTSNPAVIDFRASGMTVGESGIGSLTVNSLGTIMQTGTGGIGLAGTAGGVGVVTVDGGLITQGALSSGMGVGNASGPVPSSLLIDNNGSVLLGGAWLGIANPGGSNGTVTVTGAGSSLQLSGTAGVDVGNSGNAALTIASGGSLGLTGTGHINIGVNGGSTGQMMVSGGTVDVAATSTGGFVIGIGGTGTLVVANNGSITDGAGFAIGQNGAQGSVSVSSGSLAAAFISVGQSGIGTLTISGGNVSTGGVLGIGTGIGSSGNVTISAGSSLMAGGGIEVGEAGSGTLTIQGDSISTPSLSLGGSAITPLGNANNRATLTSSSDLLTGALAVWQGSTLSLDSTSGIDVGTSGSYISGAINLESGHTLVGNGTIAVPVVNDGVIEASGSTIPGPQNFNGLEIQGAITGSGALQIGNGGILRLDAAAPANQTIQFGSGSELILTTPGSALTNTINGLSDGDRVDLNLGVGVSITNVAVTGIGTVTVTTSTGSYQLTNVNFASGSGTAFYWGTDFNTGYQYLQVATPSVSWTGNAGDTLYSDGGNWTGGVAPNATETANFNNNPGTVSGTGSALNLNFGDYNSTLFENWTLSGANLTVAGDPNPPYLPNGLGFYATVAINGGTLNSAAGTSYIGNVEGVTVTAQGGAKVTTDGDSIGTNSGQSGTLVVTGSGSTWTEPAGPAVNGSTPGFLNVGYSGPAGGQSGSAGHLTVTADATLNTGDFATLGGGQGGYGAGTVSAGGVWTIGNGLQVGQSGVGTLAVSDGTVNASGYVAIGQNAGAEGTVSVTPAGIFNGGSALTVGSQGSGTLDVSSGTASTTGELALGSGNGSSGVVSVTGGQINAGTGLQIGGAGAGAMTIGAGGILQFGGAFDVVGQFAGGSGSLVIENGGTAKTTIAPGSSQILQIGNSGASGTLAAATGTVLVSGAGSLLNLNGNGLSVGGEGVGSLTVAQGATVEAGVQNSNSASALGAGFNTGSEAEITVTGTGSALDVNGFAGLGSGGSTNLNVSNDGQMTIGPSPSAASGMNLGVGNPNFTTGTGGDTLANVTGGGRLTVSSGGMTVGGYGASAELNVNTGGLVATLTGLTVGTATLVAGTVYGGTGSVNIGAGGTVQVTEPGQTLSPVVVIGSDSSNVGNSTGLANGAVTVTGAGASLNTNGNPIEIGRNAVGELTVSQGGSVAVGTPNSSGFAALYVGRYGDGSLILTDPGSSLTSAGYSVVGRAGTGYLLVQNHATLTVDNDPTGVDGTLSIGAGQGNPNTVVASTETGGTGTAQVTTGGYIYSQSDVTVGKFGVNGALSIDSGGSVEAGFQVIIGQNQTVQAGGTLVTATGSTITPAATVLGAQGVIDVDAGGLLRADGSGITAAGTSDIVVGDGVDTSANLDVTGAGATVNSEGYRIGVAAAGQGALLVSQGGTVLAGTPFASDEAIFAGGSAGATGAVTVTDPGSELTAIGEFAVGLGGQGSLLVENQATVTTGANAADATEGFDIAQDAGASGTVTVAGASSLLTNTGRFVVGDGGVGGLSIGSGGTVDTTPGPAPGLSGMVVANDAGASGSSVNVAGSGSQLNVTGLLDVGASGSGGLQVSGGATVTAASLDAGNISTSVGQISVTDSGSEMIIANAATVADDGTGVLSVLNGATFSAASLTIGSQGDSSGAVVVSGSGSQLNLTGALNIGTANGTGDLTVGPGAAIQAQAVFEQGQVVLEGGLLDPTVQLINQGQTAGGFGTIAAGDIVDEGAIQAGGNKGSQKLLIVQGTVLGGGTLTVNGTQPGSVPAGILQINAGGTLELTGAVLNAATTTFTDNLTPQGTYTVNNSVIDVNFVDDAGVLLLDDIAGFAGTITTYQAGDKFVITGGTLSGVTVSNGDTLLVSDSGANAGPDGIDQIIFSAPVNSLGFKVVNGNTVEAQQIICFAAGTRIETDHGPVAVEQLAVGDRVVTSDGTHEPIVWIGQRKVNCESHPEPKTVWPVRVSAGAFGENGPVRDLYLSPDHAVFVNDVLVPAKYLINGLSIAQVQRAAVTYYHVELPRHAVILAEALPVESYLDVGDRMDFQCGGAPVRLFPDFTARLSPDAALVWETRGAARLVMSGEELEAARRAVRENPPGRRSRAG